MECLGYKEVVLSSDSSSTLWNCCAWDPSTGTDICAFKRDNSAPHGLALIGQDFIIGAVKDKPIINVWTSCKTRTSEKKYVVPGIVTALSVSPRGHYCVAAISKRVYLWEISSGALLSVFDYHQQDIQTIKFTSDGFQFITGGKDGLVAVWQLTEVLAQHNASVPKRVKPLYSWNNHSSAVNDIFVGYGGFKARVATVSTDTTCRVYSLSSGKLIFSVHTNLPLHSVVMDPAEYFLSLGTSMGNILQVKWYTCLQREWITVSEDCSEVFIGHSGPVTCLSSSMDGKWLLSGSEDSTVKVWDALTRICLTTFKHYGPVTNAFFMLAPSCLRSEGCMPPRLGISPFSRVVSEGFKNKHFTKKLRTQTPTNCRLEDAFTKFTEKALSQVGVESRANLQKEVKTMRDINHQLYSFTMNSCLSNVIDYKLYEQ